MEIKKLNKIIAKFKKGTGGDPRYHNGFCSEFAIGLKRFLGNGTLCMVGGIFHVCVKYKGHYCDVNGCSLPREYIAKNPIGLNSNSINVANKDEIKHMNDLLNDGKVSEVLTGLKKAQKEIK